MEETSIGGTKYFLSFVDGFSRKVFIYIVQNKTDVPTFFEQFKARLENETCRRINTHTLFYF